MDVIGFIEPDADGQICLSHCLCLWAKVGPLIVLGLSVGGVGPGLFRVCVHFTV